MREAKKSGRIDRSRNVTVRSQATSSSPDELLRLAVRFLANRDRTIAQVEQLLTSRGASSLRVKQVIRRLSDLRYLDDVAYARRYIETRLASRPMGKDRLKAELQAKGIADHLANRTVADVFRTRDEESLAERVVKNVQRRSRRSTSIHIGRLLHQRGFTQETIDHIMIKLGMNEECVYEE